jgi:hypothetical protein
MNLSDLNHYIGNDLTASNTGDLQPVDTTVRGQQRVLRRLLTNPGDYIFHPNYGAGLPQWIGRTADLAEMRAFEGKSCLRIRSRAIRNQSSSSSQSRTNRAAGLQFRSNIQTQQPVTRQASLLM